MVGEWGREVFTITNLDEEGMGDIYGAHSNDNKKERSSSVLCSKGTVRTNRAWTIEQGVHGRWQGSDCPCSVPHGRDSKSSALQKKGWWESNINVWFPFMYSNKWNCAASLFPKQNYNVLSQNSYTHISVRDLYISRIGQSIFCCSQICGLILGIYKSLT